MIDAFDSPAHLLILAGAVKVREEPYQFSSGQKSHVHVDASMLPGAPEHFVRIIQWLGSIVPIPEISAIGGVASAAMHSSIPVADIYELPHFTVHSEATELGRQHRIDGGIPIGQRICLIEDVVVTGETALSAFNELRREGAFVTHLCCLLAHKPAHTAALFLEEGCKMVPLMTPLDIAKAYREVHAEKLDERTADYLDEWAAAA